MSDTDNEPESARFDVTTDLPITTVGQTVSGTTYPVEQREQTSDDVEDSE